MNAPVLLEAAGLGRDRGGRRILDAIDLHVAEGETLGIIGASGAGKTTLARILAVLDPPSSGTLRCRGADAFAAPRAARRALRPQIQAIFQDPAESLDPRWSAARIVAEPLAASGVPRPARPARVREALAAVGLPPSAAGRLPHEFSGGQRQRIAIARALITNPALVVADEPVSALDVSVQAQVINLLLDRRARFGTAFVFISHDLDVVRHLAHRVVVLHEGRIVEAGPAASVLARPRHPATGALLAGRPAPAVAAPTARRNPAPPC